jgi:hypothetical protein
MPDEKIEMTPLEFSVLFLYHLEAITLSRALELLRTEKPKLSTHHVKMMYKQWQKLYPELLEIHEV